MASSNIISTPHPPSISSEELEAALTDVLASSSFRSSQQCQNLLRYVVAHTLAGDDACLRERVLGHEVFGRPPAYDPGEDPVVRIRAADVRKRLATYYQSLPRQPNIRIEIPSGSYRAVFMIQPHENEAMEVAPAQSVKLESETSGTSSTALPVAVQHPGARTASLFRETGFTSRWFSLAFLTAVVGSFLLYTAVTGQERRSLVRMWKPFLTHKSPVLISVGSNSVYRLSESSSDAYSESHHLQASGMEFFPTLDPQQTLASTGLQQSPTSFVANGDVSAVAEAVTVLTELNQPTQERFPGNISFAEVQSNPTILIGGFNNPMSIEIARSLPFTMTSRKTIKDNRGNRSWVLSAPSDARDTQDYAIVTRLIASKENAPVLALAGLGQFGTLAAMHFVCDPDAIRSLTQIAGPEWERHNLQLLLRIRVIDYHPASVEVVAKSMW